MDASKITSKTSSLKALILKAWRERWTDIQWGINIKTIVPRGVSGDLYNLADCILQQAMVGCGANQLVISYLKHSLASHLVSYAAVLQRIAKFDAFHKPHCVSSLLEFLECFLDNITCRGKLEEEILTYAVSSIILWLLQVYYYCISKPSANPILSQEILEKSTVLLNQIVSSDFLLAMFYLAKQNDPEEYQEVNKKCKEIQAFMMMNTQFKAPVTIHETIQKICLMDVDKVAPLNIVAEPVTHCLQALITVNVLSNPSADMQQLSSQLLMVYRIKNYTLPRLYCELIRSCFISLNDSSKDASKQALWAAFTFVKIPQVLHYIHNTCGTTNKDAEYSVEIVEAFEKLLQATPLLDVVDTKNSCNSILSLLEPLVKVNVVSESHLSYFQQKRETKTQTKLQRLEPTGLQGSVPSFITRAEPTLAGILKTMGGDFHKTQDSLNAMLCQIVGGTTLDTILAVATVEGKLKLFVSRLIKFNDFALIAASEKGASPSKAYIFDISFLILCSIVQDYGPDAVLEENGDSFFDKWVRECMPHKGVYKSPEQILQKCESQVVDYIIHTLSSPEFDFKNLSMKPQDLCMNVSGAIKEILYAWEQGSLSAADVKRMLDSLRQKMASLSVCASVFLCSYVNVVHQEAVAKPINMIQQFLNPLTELEIQIDNFKERAVLMYLIINKMQKDIHPPSVPKSKPIILSHSIISRQPILEQLQIVWEDIKTRGYLHIESTHVIESLLNTTGPVWFVTNLVKETLKYRYQEDLDRTVDIVLAMLHLDIEKCTEALISNVLPQYLYNAKLCEELVEPQCATLAKMSVYCIYAALEASNCNRSQSSRKRRHDDSDDLDNVSSNKLRRLNDNSSDATYYSQSSNTTGIVLKEPLQSALETLFVSFSQLAGKNGDVTPQTQFILEFLVYVVRCGQERSQVILQKMSNELVPTLIKALPDSFNISLILRLYDLSNPYGRKDTARDLCLLRNMRLRPD